MSALTPAKADCSTLKPGDIAYQCSPIFSRQTAGFARCAKVLEVRDHVLVADPSGGYTPPTYWRDTGRRLSPDPGSRVYLSPVLPADYRLLDSAGDRVEVAPAYRVAA